MPTKQEKYENLLKDIQGSDFPEYFKVIVKDIATQKNINSLNKEVVSYFEKTFITDVENSLARDSFEIQTWVNILRTLANKGASLENAKSVLSTSDYNFLMQNIGGKEEEFQTVLKKGSNMIKY